MSLTGKKLNRQYSYMGRQNFISYALRAANEMGEKAIRKQVKPHWRKLNEQISKSVSDCGSGLIDSADLRHNASR